MPKNPPPGRRFGKRRQPSRSGGEGHRPKFGRPGVWDEAVVAGLAAVGVDEGDIVLGCDLEGALAGRPGLRAKLRELVADGHAALRRAVAETLARELERGVSRVLIDCAQKRLPRHRDDVVQFEEVTDAQFLAAVAKWNEAVARSRESDERFP